MNLWEAFGLGDSDGGDRSLFFVTIAALAALVAIGITRPQLTTTSLNGAFSWVMRYFGWWFLLLGFALLLFVLYMTFSRYGHIRIGGEDAETEFSRLSWIAMVFTVGFGSSIIVWGVGEPISIVTSPPPGGGPVAGAPIQSLSLAFMFLHESFPGMAMWYLPITLGFALMVYTKNVSEYKLSAMLEGVLDRDRYGFVYWAVDLAALIAMVGGLATTLGFTAQQLAAILSGVFGLQADVLSYSLFAVIGVVFLADVWLGLRKGIRNAARATLGIMLIAFAFLLVVGPTLFILDLGLDATGVWLNNIVRLMLYSSPVSDGTWAQGWTAFWWGWWAAWSLFVGSFVARISKGRTIRETFSVLVVVPSILVWAQHAVIGGWVLAPGYLQPVSTAFRNGDIPAAVAEAITLTPYGEILGVLFVLVMVGYILTTLDSAVFMLAAITLGDENPNAVNRAWWGLLLSVLGIMTLELPAFDAIRAFSPVLGLPFTFFFIVMCYVSYKAAREYYREHHTGRAGRPNVSSQGRVERRDSTNANRTDLQDDD